MNNDATTGLVEALRKDNARLRAMIHQIYDYATDKSHGWPNWGLADVADMIEFEGMHR